MKFYHFGTAGAPVIFLFPGTCCLWKVNFERVIPLLEQDFQVVCVSYDGFDETEQTIFPDMLRETEKVEAYIQEKFNGHICAAYGCSLGGSFVGLLIQRKNVRIDHGILGSSDLDQSSGVSARFQTWLITGILWEMIRKRKFPCFMERRLKRKPEQERLYYEKMLTVFGVSDGQLAFVKRESIRNQFYFDLVTPLEDQIDLPGTVIHCFYAMKMGEKYLARYQKHFKNPDIRYHDMQHEEMLFCYPSRWVQEIRECCEIVQ